MVVVIESTSDHIPQVFDGRQVWTASRPWQHFNGCLLQRLRNDARNVRSCVILLENETMSVDSRNDNGSDDLRQISCGVEIAVDDDSDCSAFLHIPPQIITEPPPYLWCSQMQSEAYRSFAIRRTLTRPSAKSRQNRLSSVHRLDPILNSN